MFKSGSDSAKTEELDLELVSLKYFISSVAIDFVCWLGLVFLLMIVIVDFYLIYVTDSTL